ncbi:hypothetical protein OH77DRAFT_1014066 [Trametes cingulata]|nr:hypothetical protein OH77DRAFT_1014066 [Trametes cingulata]
MYTWLGKGKAMTVHARSWHASDIEVPSFRPERRDDRDPGVCTDLRHEHEHDIVAVSNTRGSSPAGGRETDISCSDGRLAGDEFITVISPTMSFESNRQRSVSGSSVRTERGKFLSDLTCSASDGGGSSSTFPWNRVQDGGTDSDVKSHVGAPGAVIRSLRLNLSLCRSPRAL